MLDLTQITATIQKRFSCRTYQDKLLDSSQVANLTAMAEHLSGNFFNSQLRFSLISASEEDRASLKRLGTYGTIRNPVGFLTGTVFPSRYDMEAFGYRMEEFILYATQLDLGTCWLGGFFTKSSFARKLDLLEGEVLPAVVSIGWIDENRGVVDRMFRQQTRAHHRFAWEQVFFDGSFERPLNPPDAGRYAEALEMVRIAPSASNKQPWRVVKQGDCWHFYLQRTHGYPPSFLKLADLQRADIGIAMCHFSLTLASQGLAGSWQDIPPKSSLPGAPEYIISWVAA